MRYFYLSPICGQWVWIDWHQHNDLIRCPHFDQSYYPPGPADQHQAYVDTHEWPKEMEEAVFALRGPFCTVPGCRRLAETLDHRIPYVKNGRTSVANLWPMCRQHNLSKSDTPYEVWLLIKDLDQFRRSLR